MAPEAWLMTAALSTKTLPPIVLPSDADIVAGGSDFVVSALCTHLGIKPECREKLNSWFYRSGFFGRDEDLADTICRNAIVLQELGLDRFTVAEKMEQVLRHPNKEWIVAIYIEYNGTSLRRFLSVRILFVILGAGGSSDCVIINKQLSASGDRKALSVKNWKELLGARLNAKKRPEWEEWDGVLYLSDMQPYLTRQGLFQGLESRYRMDPERVVRILSVQESAMWSRGDQFVESKSALNQGCCNT